MPRNAMSTMITCALNNPQYKKPQYFLLIFSFLPFFPFTNNMDIFINASLLTHYDLFLEWVLKFRGTYYIVHTFVNLYILYNLYLDDLKTCIEITYALHLYHSGYYIRKFQIDDWLHHLIMLCVVLPIATFLLEKYPHQGHDIMIQSFFFMSGLPGAIEYSTLALHRNGYISRVVQKRWSVETNTWIRMPGCIIISTQMLQYFFEIEKMYNRFLVTFVAFLVMWNGIYFCRRSIESYYKILR